MACLRAAAAKMAAGFVDTAAGWVPDSVPRPVAKAGVAVVGGLIVLSIVQKVGGVGGVDRCHARGLQRHGSCVICCGQ
jgi:hypothetical protein